MPKSAKPAAKPATTEIESSSPPQLTFECGEHHHFEFESPSELSDPDALRRIQEACRTVGQTAKFAVPNLLAWGENERRQLFALLGSLQTPYSINLGRGEKAELLEAVLDIWDKPANPQRCAQGQVAAIEAAAFAFPKGQEELAASLIADRAKQLGIKSILPQSLGKQIKALRQSTQQVQEGQSSNPLGLAEAYLDELRTVTGLPPEQRPLHFFQSDFFRWTGRVWKRIRDGELESDVIRHLQRNPNAKHLTAGTFKSVVKNLEGLCLVPNWDEARLPLWVPMDGEPESPSQFLAFANRLVDLSSLLADESTANVLDLNPQHFSPVILPYDCDQEAQCQTWLQALDQWLPRQTIEGDKIGDHRQEVLQEAFGWCLLTGTLAINLERFFILHGNGANGKSTVLNVLEQMLGRENVSHVPLEEFDGNFKLYPMADKLANVGFDMSRPDKPSEGKLKTLVSGEPVQVDRKFKDPLTIYPTAKLFFATNELPSFGDRSDGIWRRAVILPFQVQIPAEERDRGLSGRLRAELPGILNWALEGARRLLKNNDFTRCSVCERVAADHRVACDSFLAFVQECTEWIAVRDRETEQNLFNAYRRHCDENLGVKNTGRPKFIQRLRELEAERQRCPSSTDREQRLRLKPAHDYLATSRSRS